MHVSNNNIQSYKERIYAETPYLNVGRIDGLTLQGLDEAKQIKVAGEYKAELDVIANQVFKSANMTDSKEYKELLTDLKEVQECVNRAANPARYVEYGSAKFPVDPSNRASTAVKAIKYLTTKIDAYRCI